MHQRRLTPGFAFTEYKVEGAMFESAVFDLWQKSRKRKEESHKQCCFIYVQLFWLPTLQDIFLLEMIDHDNIDNKPYVAL